MRFLHRIFLCVLLFILFFLGARIILVKAVSSWSQASWIGGSGQSVWNDVTKYNTETNTSTTTANQITLTTNSNWFNTSWKYRNSTNITNNSGATLTDMQVPLFINTANLISNLKMESDCKDLRITDSNGNLLDYWIATSPSTNTCNKTTTKVWVKIPSIPTTGITLYLYYGNNNAASLSNGENVFLEFADFTTESALPTGWTKTDVGTSGTATVNSGKLSISNTNGADVWVTEYGGTHVYNNTSVNGSFIAEALITSQSNSSEWAKSGISVQNIVGASVANGQAFIIVTPNNGYDFQYQNTTAQGCTNGLCPGVIAANANSNTGSVSFPSFLKITKNNSNQITGSRSTDGTSWTQQGSATPWGISSSQYVTLMVTPHSTSGTSTATYTFFYIRKFTTSEPTIGSWGTEQNTYVTAGTLTSSIFDTQGSTNFENLNYAATVPTNTSISVKIRTSSNSDMSGASDFSTCNSINSGDNISSNNCVTNGNRYIQYQIILSTTDSTLTPIFKSFSLDYTTTPIYSLTYTAGANGTLSGNTSQNILSGSNGTAITANPNNHFHFVNWSDNSTANPRTDINISGNISVTANFAIDTYSVVYSAGTNGAITGNTNQTINWGGDASEITAVANSLYHFTNWSDSSTANPRTDYNVTKNISVSANFAANDPNAPIISSVNANASSITANINWTTDETASSQVQYGLNTQYGFSTNETDISPRITSHSINLTNLTPCARYYYRVLSKDETNNQSASAQKTFNTTGCVTSSVTNGSENLLPITGGTVALTNNLSTAQISVPNNYATEEATFQLNKLDSNNAPIGPDGKTIATNNFYDLVAVTTNNQQLTSFSQPITFEVNYGSDTETNFDEQSLDIYKYNGTNWDKKNCTLNTSANTLTCSLSGFSIYAVLGISKNNSSSNTNNNSSSSSNSSSNTSSSCSNSKPTIIPDLFQIDANSTSAKLFFTPTDVNDFFISFSEQLIAEDYGTQVSLAKEGVQNYTIYYLKPNTIYYIKIRGQNGCAPGDWSNVMKIKTNLQSLSTPLSFYRYGDNLKNNVFLVKEENILPTPTIIAKQKKQETKQVYKINKTSPEKKSCILWFCF